MKKIEVLYSDTQQLKLTDLMKMLGSNKTDMARAAMWLGLNQIQELASRDMSSAQELVAVTAYKAKQ
jgi:hypothetical protein